MTPAQFAQGLGHWASSGGPLYRALAESIRRRIEEGLLHGGARLPAERVLAKALAVSRTTVVGAYELLREEGFIESRQGSGTRVRRGDTVERPATQRDTLTAGAFERNTLFRGLIESSGSAIELLGVHLPASSFVAEALEEIRGDLLPLLAQHGYTGLGLPRLREAIARHLTRTGMPSSPDQILVTHGAQQAIGLAAALYLQPGDAVVLEDPTYLGAIDVFTAAGARTAAVPISEDGVRLEALREAVSREAPRLVYLMPTFHNPAGSVMPAAARREVARLARERSLPVLEDNTLAELDLDAPPPAPIGAFSGDAPVLTVGSLSKLVWGGLRIGWVRAPEPIIQRLARLKVMGDLGNSVVSQALAARLFERLDEIRKARRREIAARRETLCAELSRRLPEWTWRRPAGGLSLWARIPRGNASELAQVALRHGVSVLPGSTCSPRNGFADYLRLPFVLEPEQIRQGIRRLAEAWRAYSPAPRRERAASLDVLV